MSQNLNLQRVEVFLAIVDNGGISAAARTLGLAQSTVSAQLQKLETEVGAVLVERNSRGHSLTEAGRSLRDNARGLTDLAARTLEDIARIRHLPIAGTLRIGGTITTATSLLPRRIAEFARDYPEVDVDLVVDNTVQVTGMVSSGTLPFAVVAAPADAFFDLECEQIGLEEQVIVVSATHPLAGLEVSADELRWSRALLREDGSATRRAQLTFLQARHIPSLKLSTIASDAAIIGAVSAGLGFSVLPAPAVELALREGSIARVRMNPDPEPRPIQLIRRIGRHHTALEDLFLERLKKARQT